MTDITCFKKIRVREEKKMGNFFSWQLIFEYFPNILSALPVTLMIVGVSTIIGLLLGSAIAFIRVEQIPLLGQTETFRAAILSVPTTQKEASIAFGLTKYQMYTRVIFPQVVRVALPSFGTTTVALLQDTSLAFTIGVIDVVGKARAIGSVTFRTLEGYIGAAIIFIVLSIVLERIFASLETQMSFEQKRSFAFKKPRLTLFKRKQKLVEGETR